MALYKCSAYYSCGTYYSSGSCLGALTSSGRPGDGRNSTDSTEPGVFHSADISQYSGCAGTVAQWRGDARGDAVTQ